MFSCACVHIFVWIFAVMNDGMNEWYLCICGYSGTARTTDSAAERTYTA